MEKEFIVPVNYFVSDDNWNLPEVYKVMAEDAHNALLKVRAALVERESRGMEDPGEYPPSVWHHSALTDIWDPSEACYKVDPTYGEPDEEGWVMGDPILLEEINIVK